MMITRYVRAEAGLQAAPMNFRPAYRCPCLRVIAVLLPRYAISSSSNGRRLIIERSSVEARYGSDGLIEIL